MRYYNVWAGNPKGWEEDVSRCLAAVSARGQWSEWSVSPQCPFKRGQGPDGLYCGNHARMIARGKVLHVPRDTHDQ